MCINWSRVGGILNLVAVAGSDRGVAAAAVAVSIESLKAVFAWQIVPKWP